MIRLTRKKGFKLTSPNGLPVVKVDRTTKWGNPTETKAGFRLWMEGLNPCWNAKETLDQTEQRRLWIWRNIEKLRGKNLACWCKCKPDALCHADVLLEIANN